MLQAIALSLQDSVSSPSRSPGAHLTNTFSKTSTKGNSCIENESGKRKRKKPVRDCGTVYPFIFSVFILFFILFMVSRSAVEFK